MRVWGAVLGGVVVAVLIGCSVPPQPQPTSTPSETTPAAEVAPVGEAAIPLGCSDLLAVSDVAHLGADFDEDLTLAVDENRIAVDMTVAELQRGTLRCVWAARYGATDFHAVVDLRVAPSTQTELVPAAEESRVGELAPLDGDGTTLLACSDGFQADNTSALYNQCDVVQLRAGYRIDLQTSALKASAQQDSSVAVALLAKVDGAIDGAGPARVVEPVAGTTDPASVCQAFEIAAVLEHLKATGPPTVEQHAWYSGVTTCAWNVVDEYGNVTGPWVYVLPGGAWAIPRLGTGVSSIFMPTHLSSDGSFLIGVGDGVSAWRAVGDDLVQILSGDFDASTDWEAFLEATW